MSDYVNININGEQKAAMLVFSISENQDLQWNYVADENGINNTTSPVVIKSASPGRKNCISCFEFSTDGELGTPTELVIRDGVAGDILWRAKLGTNGLPSGRILAIEGAIKGSVNKDLVVQTLTATGTGSVYVNAIGFES